MFNALLEVRMRPANPPRSGLTQIEYRHVLQTGHASQVSLIHVCERDILIWFCSLCPAEAGIDSK